MAVSNLHTLDSDTLYEILILCPNLTSLYSLITTHPTIYHVFSTRRRLILRHVFRNWGHITAADDFISRIKCTNSLDYVAFREALWPLMLQKFWPNKLSVPWATALLTTYHRAGLKEEKMYFAKEITGFIMQHRAKKHCGRDMRTLVRAVIRTYMAGKLFIEAVVLQEEVRRRLDPRKPEHSVWCKELVVANRKISGEGRALLMQIECWELYKTVVGPSSDVALDWARGIVKEYQVRGQEKEALNFHQKVRSELDPTTASYVAWSRQLIHMLQREKKDKEALVITEDVWRHLAPNAKGYRAWTRQLGEMYEAMGRWGDAVAVCRACWSAIIERLEQAPNSEDLRYQARGAGLMFVNVLRRCGRPEDAREVEDRCKDFKI